MNMTCKLDFDILEILRSKSKEAIDFVLYLAQCQDKLRRCSGIYYKETATEINICNQSFYNILYFLEKEGVIKIYREEKDHKTGDWDVRFENLKKINTDRYLNTNVDFLYTDEFRSLRLNAKILTLYLLGLKQNRKGQKQKLTFRKLMEYAGTERIDILMQYLNELEAYFDISYLDDGIEICLKPEHMIPTLQASMKQALHTVKYICRRRKSEYELEDIISTAIMYCKFRENYGAVFLEVLQRALEKYLILNPEYIEGKLIERLAELKIKK